MIAVALHDGFWLGGVALAAVALLIRPVRRWRSKRRVLRRLEQLCRRDL